MPGRADEPRDGVTPEWPTDREWAPDDARWDRLPSYTQAKPDEIPKLVDQGAQYGRAVCPLIPENDRVLLRISSVPFLTLSGVSVAMENQPAQGGAHAPFLVVVSCGPDADKYRIGDYVMLHPNNQELTLEWADPRPPHASATFILVQEKHINARYDKEIIDQLRLRKKYCDKLVADRKKEEAEKKRVEDSPLNPHTKLEVLDALGQPVKKTGYHEA